MTNEQILKKAIEKAERNGWDNSHMIKQRISYFQMGVDGMYNHVIFSHSFAKAFWGEGGSTRQGYTKGWKDHLKLMVLESEPLKYLEKFL